MDFESWTWGAFYAWVVENMSESYTQYGTVCIWTEPTARLHGLEWAEQYVMPLPKYMPKRGTSRSLLAHECWTWMRLYSLSMIFSMFWNACLCVILCGDKNIWPIKLPEHCWIEHPISVMRCPSPSRWELVIPAIPQSALLQQNGAVCDRLLRFGPQCFGANNTGHKAKDEAYKKPNHGGCEQPVSLYRVRSMILCAHSQVIWFDFRWKNSWTRMLRIKSMWSYTIHVKDFLAISEIFENFHIQVASQPMLS